MQVTATEAKNRFGYYCAQAKSEPVVVEKDGRPDTVLLDFEVFQDLQRQAREPRTLAERHQAFNETYGDWLQAQREDFERCGLWCDGLEAWMNPR